MTKRLGLGPSESHRAQQTLIRCALMPLDAR